MSGEVLPLFPLNAVLFSGCRLDLQIFEQRYLRMITDCLKANSEFVIILISRGEETGATPEINRIGTRARIVDWNQLENGLLGITVEGTGIVRADKLEVMDDGLLTARISHRKELSLVDEEQRMILVPLLKQLKQHPFLEQLGLETDYCDLNRVLWQLCGLLPFSNRERQALLELTNPEQRLARFTLLLKELEED